MSGRITFPSPFGPQLVVLDGAVTVQVAGDTWIVRGGQMGSYGELQVSQGSPRTACRGRARRCRRSTRV
ncbi:MAG: hypothetical protein QN163_00915 [Armatimonadota bacterium]|nr:hypothetical protein [Armatimonadota bacterium]MDR5697366.1 hypothetical protein [Armatimonadota bacterium]